MWYMVNKKVDTEPLVVNESSFIYIDYKSKPVLWNLEAPLRMSIYFFKYQYLYWLKRVTLPGIFTLTITEDSYLIFDPHVSGAGCLLSDQYRVTFKALYNHCLNFLLITHTHTLNLATYICFGIQWDEFLSIVHTFHQCNIPRSVESINRIQKSSLAENFFQSHLWPTDVAFPLINSKLALEKIQSVDKRGWSIYGRKLPVDRHGQTNFTMMAVERNSYFLLRPYFYYPAHI